MWVASKILGNKILGIWTEQISASSTSGGISVLVTNHKHSLPFVKLIYPEMTCSSSALDLVQRVWCQLQVVKTSPYIFAMAFNIELSGIGICACLTAVKETFPIVCRIPISMVHVTHEGHEARVWFLLVSVGLLVQLCARHV